MDKEIIDFIDSWLEGMRSSDITIVPNDRIRNLDDEGVDDDCCISEVYIDQAGGVMECGGYKTEDGDAYFVDRKTKEVYHCGIYGGSY